MSTRRRFLVNAALTVTTAGLGPGRLLAAESPLETRPIPATGEALPVIGMGTSTSFEIGADRGARSALAEVLRRFVDGGGRLIDTSPSYSDAEDVLGGLLADAQLHSRVFLATKLSGVTGRAAGRAQFQASQRRLRSERIDLLQVHNLGDWRTQLALARELKAEGLVRYVGLTHYHDSAHDALAAAVEAERPDFLQINYSVTQRGAERRVFPVAREHGVAVLANRNFDDGALFARVADTPVPEWATEAGIGSWAQLFLRFALSHPAVTVVIPATGKPDRQSDNLRAGRGPALDARQRQALIDLLG
jgi:aryl-alcohol dehydrogenase-like predicted oxidoreductase